MNSDGFSEPFMLLHGSVAAELATKLRFGPAPATWLKGAAATSPDVYTLATKPDLLDRVEAAIGPDIVLCGANLVERDPGQHHPWHTDAHYAGDSQSRTVSLWLGLEGVDAATTLHVIPGSHRYGASPQRLLAEREALTASTPSSIGGPYHVDEAEALDLARSLDAQAQVMALPLTDGMGVLFDGSLWHGTRNAAGHARSALVVHYAAPDVPVRIHGNGLVWPLSHLEDPLPPCHLVRGRDNARLNRLAPAPPGVMALNAVHQPDPTLGDGPPDWKPDPLHKGPTSRLAHLLVKRHAVHGPEVEHRPHAHEYDQIVITVGGEGRLALGGDSSLLDAPLGPSSVAFVPAGTLHAAWNLHHDTNHVHVDVSFMGGATSGMGPEMPLGPTVVDLTSVPVDPVDLDERGRSSVTVFEGSTLTTERVSVKRVDLAPGFRGVPDVDDYDVVLVVHTGRIRTLDAVAGPGSVVFYGASETHEIQNEGSEAVSMTVVELHGRSGGITTSRRSPNGFASLGTSALRRRIVRRLPRGVRLAVRRWRRALRNGS